MSEPHAALEALRDAGPPPGTIARIQAGAWDRIDGQRTARAGWWIGGLLAAAGAAAALWLVDSGASRVAPPPTPAARAGLAVAPHRVTAGEGADLVVLDRAGDGARLRLTRGSATFAVAPLAPNEKFVVETPRADVAVIGTRFSVTVEGDCTRVQVLEGRVSVVPTDAQAPSMLGAGEARAVCAPLDPAPTAPPSTAPATVAAPAAPESAAPVLDGLVPGQAQVYEAMRLFKARRDLERAAALLAGYAEAHPQGAFLEEALYYLAEVQGARGLEAEAQAAAQRFIKHFPQGYRADRLRRRHGR